MGRWYPRQDNESTDTGRMLGLLTRLGDVTRLETFLAEIAARGGFDLGDVPTIAEAIRLLPPEHAPSVTERLISGSAEMTIAVCGALLADIASLGHPIVTGAAKCLVDALPDGSPGSGWRRGPGVSPRFVVDLFTALVRIDPVLAGRAAAHMLSLPKSYDFDIVLIPAVRDMLGRAETAVAATVERLRLAASRISMPVSRKCSKFRGTGGGRVRSAVHAPIALN